MHLLIFNAPYRRYMLLFDLENFPESPSIVALTIFKSLVGQLQGVDQGTNPRKFLNFIEMYRNLGWLEL